MAATVSFGLAAETLARLDRVAEYHGLKLKGHGRTGRPNRTEALRQLIDTEFAKIERLEKKSRKIPENSID